MPHITKKQILSSLAQVLDPELGISIVDLGFIYNVQIQKNKVHITMTLTTMGCPMFFLIEEQIKENIEKLGIKKDYIKIELVFDPPWSVDKISKKARKILGL